MQEFVESRREEGRGNEVSVTDFLQEVSLQTDFEGGDVDEDGNDAVDGRVALMTVHSAKGLEFPSVFVVGLEENIFPSLMSLDSRRQIEEERRLLYVAITRAERRCILTYAKSRYRYGRMEMETPSRFLRDINPALLDIDDGSGDFTGMFGSSLSKSRIDRWQNSRPVASQFKADPVRREVLHDKESFADETFSPAFRRMLSVSSAHRTVRRSSSDDGYVSANELSENSIIEHERFGRGTVIRLEGTGENRKATVVFKNAGTKQLLLKFARFKIVDNEI